MPQLKNIFDLLCYLTAQVTVDENDVQRGRGHRFCINFKLSGIVKCVCLAFFFLWRAGGEEGGGVSGNGGCKD
jgi:hypothetical protein